jgi:hypothetical protein
MKGLIPADFIADLRSRLDIVSVVDSTVSNLKKSGDSYKCACPFHEDKNPSFSVSSKKQIFKCFSGCSGSDGGGDVFKFIQLFHKVSFKEAVEIAADHVGMAIPKFAPAISIPQDQKLVDNVISGLPSIFEQVKHDDEKSYVKCVSLLSINDIERLAIKIECTEAELMPYASGFDYGFTGSSRSELQSMIGKRSDRFKRLAISSGLLDEKNRVFYPDDALVVTVKNKGVNIGLVFITDTGKATSMSTSSEYRLGNHILGMDTVKCKEESASRGKLPILTLMPDVLSMIKARQLGHKDTISSVDDNVHSTYFLTKVFNQRAAVTRFVYPVERFIGSTAVSLSFLQSHVCAALECYSVNALYSVFILSDEDMEPADSLVAAERGVNDLPIMNFDDVFELYFHKLLSQKIMNAIPSYIDDESVNQLKLAIASSSENFELAHSIFASHVNNIKDRKVKSATERMFANLTKTYGLGDLPMTSLASDKLNFLLTESNDRVVKALIGCCLISTELSKEFKPENIPGGASPSLRRLLWSVANTAACSDEVMSAKDMVMLFDDKEKKVILQGLIMATRAKPREFITVSAYEYGQSLIQANQGLLQSLSNINDNPQLADADNDSIFTLLHELQNNPASIGHLNQTLML